MTPSSSGQRRRRLSQTKIVATLGPACDSDGRLRELIDAGVDVFRINAAHATIQEHQQRVDAVRRVSQQAGCPIGILVDLAGPKIRLHEIQPDGQAELVRGETVRFARNQEVAQPGDLTVTYDPLIDELSVGDRIVLADGVVQLRVEQVDENFAVCRITQSGTVRSRQGVNLPGVKLSAPTLGPHDREVAVWAARAGVDFVGLSFVRSPEDIRQARTLLENEKGETQVVAKIEKPEALDALEEIVHEADAVMVARGDLGVEIDIAEIPIVQKRIVEMCHQHCKPVIIATQMLDSMQHSRMPTRAEATDVANAILDGADACMLSGETAVGEYPVETVEMMHRIALATEPAHARHSNESFALESSDFVDEITDATAFAAGCLAEELHAEMLVVATASGRTALRISKNRHFVPILGYSESETTLRRMCLYWGVIPIRGEDVDNYPRLMQQAVQYGRSAGYLSPGDRVVLIGGTGLSSTHHNAVVIHQID